MKTLKIVLYFMALGLVLPQHSQAQMNLVSNPSFEDTLFCPEFISQIHAATGWENYGGTPEYYNACNDNALNVPNSVFGFQPAHSGNGRAGLVTYRDPTLPQGPNIREFIGQSLTSPLQQGTKYYFSLFVNCANVPYHAIASNGLGLKFSTQSYDSASPPLLDNFSHIELPIILVDTINWYKLTGSFIADSNYTNIIIGNFRTDTNTDTISLSQFPQFAYYYIDDVCVSIDSNYTNTWTGIHSINTSNISIFPNPTSKKITINNIDEKIDLLVTLSDIHGRLVANYNLKQKREIIIEHVPYGMYILIIKSKQDYLFTHRIIYQP